MKTTIAERVKALRTHLRMTQQDFCEIAGMRVTSLSRIENGEVEPRESTLLNVIDATGVDPVWLLEGKGEMKIVSNPKERVSSGDLYRDALYAELKEQAVEWKQKYNELWRMFTKLADGGSLGKYRTIGKAAVKTVPVVG